MKIYYFYKWPFFLRDYTKFPTNWRDEFSIKVTSVDKALRLTVDYVIVYIADIAARFGSTDAVEFTLQQQSVKIKAANNQWKFTISISYVLNIYTIVDLFFENAFLKTISHQSCDEKSISSKT
jgi:hypothetical protein